MQYLPYHEPAVTTLLIYASFILLLNAVNLVLDRLLYCGLIGQILIGTAWRVPGANWLTIDAQQIIVQLGYLGLILLVYEGGLSTSLSSVRQNLWLSIGVAATGIALPMALSFVLMPLVDASPLQAFAAGAALCSTSLGTTFTVLSTCNLTTTRLGTVLTTAAMLDDVVGLIMVQVISELGQSSAGITTGTVLRPIGVSFAVVFALFMICRFVVAPLSRLVLSKIEPQLARASHAAFVIHSLFLVGIFAGATYAGTSGLFAAYLAGLTLTWWDKSCAPNATGAGLVRTPKSASYVFDSGYAAVTTVLLKPFFFASIGFSIPIVQLFSGPVVWKGIVYTVLMLTGKLAVGLWLARLPSSKGSGRIARLWSNGALAQSAATQDSQRAETQQQLPGRSTHITSVVQMTDRRNAARTTLDESRADLHPSSPSSVGEHSEDLAAVSATQPVSLYPACLLGLAMAARGEIGYLIAFLAESSGIFDGSGDGENAAGQTSPMFLVVVWAISLCTLIGPCSVGLIVRRIRRLEKERGEVQGRRAALGIWGMEPEN